MKKALIIMTIILIAGCLKKGSEYTFDLNIVAEIMGCTAVDESYTDHTISGEKLVLTTYAVTPDLCYKLEEIKTSRIENNITINIEIEEEIVGICGTCRGALTSVYEITKPPYNETNMMINIIIEKELMENHGFTIETT